jgi:hypothetical protein
LDKSERTVCSVCFVVTPINPKTGAVPSKSWKTTVYKIGVDIDFDSNSDHEEPYSKPLVCVGGDLGMFVQSTHIPFRTHLAVYNRLAGDWHSYHLDEPPGTIHTIVPSQMDAFVTFCDAYDDSAPARRFSTACHYRVNIQNQTTMRTSMPSLDSFVIDCAYFDGRLCVVSRNIAHDGRSGEQHTWFIDLSHLGVEFILRPILRWVRLPSFPRSHSAYDIAMRVTIADDHVVLFGSAGAWSYPLKHCPNPNALAAPKEWTIHKRHSFTQ